MAKIETKIGNKTYEVISKKEFRSKYHNVTDNALDYACEKNKIDYITIGKTKMIVITEKTLMYTPNKSNRDSIGGVIKYK